MKKIILSFLFMCIVSTASCGNCSLLSLCNKNIRCLFDDITQFNLSGCSPLDASQYFTGSLGSDSSITAYFITSLSWHTPLKTEMSLGPMINLILGAERVAAVNLTKSINLEHFDGFDIDLYLNGSPMWINFLFQFHFFSFKLYSHDEPVSLTNCSYFHSEYTHKANTFTQFGSILFMQCVFSSSVCSSVFTNIVLDQMIFVTYLPEFIPANYSVNSSIEEFVIQGVTKLSLTSKLLSPDLLYKTMRIIIRQSSLYHIDSELFKSLSNMKKLELSVINLRSFLHSRGISWIGSINYGVDYASNNSTDVDYIKNMVKIVSFLVRTTQSNVTMTQALSNYMNYQVYDKVFFPFLDYTFPDQDFCLFKDFPFNQLVVADVESDIECTCTLLWLFQHASLLYQMRILTSLLYSDDKHPFSSCPDFYQDSFNSALDQCQFEKMQNSCLIQPVSYQPNDPYFNMYDLSKGLSEAKSVLIEYLGPVVCLFGLITNSLVIMTLIHNYKRRSSIMNKILNKDKEIVFLKEPLYQYMLLSSIFNAASCLMYLLDYTIPCVPDASSVEKFYEVYTNMVTDKCWSLDVSLSILGSVLKLMSNFTFIQMLTHRYILTGKDHLKLLEISSSISIKSFVVVSIVISTALSSIVYFQKRFFAPFFMNTELLFSDDYAYNHYYWTYSPIIKAVVKAYQVEKIQNIPTLLLFTVIHDLMSYFLFCLISTGLDVLTILKLKEIMANKEKVTQQAASTDKSRDPEMRGIIMIVLSSLVNFIFRAPELISVIFFYIFTLDGPYVFKTLCFMYNKCLTFVDLANTFYLLSISLNLIFYVKFNSVFRSSFKKLFLIFKKD